MSLGGGLRVVALGIPALLALSLVPLASGTEQAFPGKPGKLVFQSNRDGNFELYIANANGAGVKKLLSRSQTDEFNANWSPSGRKLVFQTGPPDRSTYDIWTVGHDGKGAAVLVGGATNDRAPQFCDERTVVFTRQLDATNAEIYAIGADGKGLRKLTDHPASDSFPTCNPKGTRIAFISNRDGGAPRIYEMTRTGSGLRPLTDPGAADPDYSSDGKAIAYVALDADRNLEVFTKNLTTGAVTQRTNAAPPNEYRLPKFVPASSARALAGRAGDRDALYATYRAITPPLQAAAEALHLVTAGPTSAPVAEPASGGSSQATAPPCKCEDLTAEIDRFIPRGPNITDLTPSRVSIEITIAWWMTCTLGKGGCTGKLGVSPTVADKNAGLRIKRLRGTPRTGAVTCEGTCNTLINGDRVTFRLTGGAAFGAGKLGKSVKQISIEVDRVCGNRVLAPSVFELRFKTFPDGSIEVDRNGSDLNGNGILDNEEPKKKP